MLKQEMNNHKRDHILTNSDSYVDKHKELAWETDLCKFMVFLEVIP